MRRPKIGNTVEGKRRKSRGTALLIVVVLIAGAIPVNLLLAVVLLGIAAYRQHERADPLPVTDEVDVVAAYAETATAAAEHALEQADQALHAAVEAAAARDMAEQRHRLALKHAQAAGESRQLLQRAALDAYQRRQLSVTELNRIWQHAQVIAEPPSRPAAVPLGWELRVREARRRYEQAEAEAARADEEARSRAATAETLAEEARAAESLRSAAMHSASTGLVGLLRANWAEPALTPARVRS